MSKEERLQRDLEQMPKRRRVSDEEQSTRQDLHKSLALGETEEKYAISQCIIRG